jgi:hypothetical protein
MKSVRSELVEGCRLQQAQHERVLRLLRTGSITFDHLSTSTISDVTYHLNQRSEAAA